MKSRMIFFDVDGTLIDNTFHQIAPSTLKALQLLKENHYYIGIATGRSVASLKMTGIMDIIEWDGYVCNSGQSIVSKDKQVVKESFIDASIVRQAIDIATQQGNPINLKMKNRILVGKPNDYVYTTQKFFQNVIPPVGQYHGEPVEAMIAYGPIGHDYQEYQLPGLSVMPGESTYCDLAIAGLSKATGIQYFLDDYHCQDYLCFGDSLNDMEMFKHAAYSVCLGQGNKQAQDAADYVTNDILHDGIYKACKVLNLI